MILPTRDRPSATARKLTAFAATLVTWNLVQFVEELSRINSGRAYYSSLDNLGNYIFADYANRRRNVRWPGTRAACQRHGQFSVARRYSLGRRIVTPATVVP